MMKHQAKGLCQGCYNTDPIVFVEKLESGYTGPHLRESRNNFEQSTPYGFAAASVTFASATPLDKIDINTYLKGLRKAADFVESRMKESQLVPETQEPLRRRRLPPSSRTRKR